MGRRTALLREELPVKIGQGSDVVRMRVGESAQNFDRPPQRRVVRLLLLTR
jgi:hypothetical protein